MLDQFFELSLFMIIIIWSIVSITVTDRVGYQW